MGTRNAQSADTFLTFVVLIIAMGLFVVGAPTSNSPTSVRAQRVNLSRVISVRHAEAGEFKTPRMARCPRLETEWCIRAERARSRRVLYAKELRSRAY
jgi:hypothetical protein